MRTLILLVTLPLAGCALAPPDRGPLPAPPVEEARALLDEIVDAALERDFDRLCANATGTCEGELENVKDLAPSAPPKVIRATAHAPIVHGDSWTSGGILFVLCGSDAEGSAYESEVYVFDDGDRLIATAAVFWVGTRVTIAAPGELVLAGGPTPGAGAC